ncbi:MAG TPA: sodium:proton exchanger [Gammaproteobacteria bacterium]|nr:sodium:proton exchanger [Gammaproteobacteria bacterium]
MEHLEIVWISFAFVLGFVVRQLGLPPLIGYLLAGFSISAFGFGGGEWLAKVSHVGVLLLLFSVGLKLRLNSLVRPEVLAGSVLHMSLSVLIMGPVLHGLLGFGPGPAFFTAMALAFSSTVVAAKVLESKRELRAFHGRVAIGILVMQDLVAVALLSFANGATPTPWALLVLTLPLLRPLIHRLLDWNGHDELLILYGLLLALVIGGSGFEMLGLSSELGALLLGAVLADHRRASELSNALWGLKEVFLVGFFLQIGIAGLPTLEQVGWALLLAALLPVKAALFFVILLRFGLRARSSFLAALSLATFSEFGLIVANIAVQKGFMDQSWLVLLALAVAVSFALAAPLNRNAHDLYRRLEPRLLKMESARRHPDDQPLSLGGSTVLIVGMGRVGTAAYDFFTQREQRVVGVDSDPVKVAEHVKKGRRVLYADSEDPGLWHNIDLSHVRAVLLATPDSEANSGAARLLRQAGFPGLVHATAMFPEEVQAVKQAGANGAYYYFDTVGVGFAEHVWEQLEATVPAKNDPS